MGVVDVAQGRGQPRGAEGDARQGDELVDDGEGDEDDPSVPAQAGGDEGSDGDGGPADGRAPGPRPED